MSRRPFRGGYSGGYGGYPMYGGYAPYSYGFRRFRRRIIQREGDWFCGNCNIHNFASRQVCRRCGKQRDSNAHVVSAEMAAAALPPRREGDWDCPNCKFVCFLLFILIFLFVLMNELFYFFAH